MAAGLDTLSFFLRFSYDLSFLLTNETRGYGDASNKGGNARCLNAQRGVKSIDLSQAFGVSPIQQRVGSVGRPCSPTHPLSHHGATITSIMASQRVDLQPILVHTSSCHVVNRMTVAAGVK